MVHKSLIDMIKICSVLPALAIMPAYADAVCDGNDCVVEEGSTWLFSGKDGDIINNSNNISGAGTIILNPYSNDPVLNFYGKISDFTGTFKSGQVSSAGNQNHPSNWYPTMIFHNWADGQTFNLGTDKGAAGAFIFAGENTVKIAANGANQGKIFLNDNKLDVASTVTGAVTHVYLGGQDNDDGRIATMDGYNLEKGNLFIGGEKNMTTGNLIADISDSKFFGIYGGTDNIVLGKVVMDLENVDVADRIVGMYVKSGGDSLMSGIDISLKNGSTAAGLYGQQIDMSGGSTKKTGATAIKLSVENSTVGNLRGVNANVSEDYYDKWMANYIPAEFINIKLKNSVVTDEMMSVGPYLRAGDVRIDVIGNSRVGYKLDENGVYQVNDKQDGWIIAGAQRPGSYVNSTVVNLNTDGDKNAIYIAGDVNVGSREKSGVNNSDIDSVRGDATLNMLGGGEIYTGDLRAYHVKGTRTLNIANVKATTGKITEFNVINIGNNATLVSNDTISLAPGGVIKVAGDITGSGALTLAEGAALYLSSGNIEQGSLELNGDMFINLDPQDKFGHLYADTITGTGTVNLGNITKAGTYKIFNQDNELNVKAGLLFNVENNGAKGIVVSHRTADNIAEDTGLSVEASALMFAMADSSNRQFHQRYKQMVADIEAHDPLADYEAAYYDEQAARANPYDKPMLHSMTTSLSNQVLDLAVGRMSGGRAGGDMTVGYGAWVQGMHNKSKYSDSFSASTGGLAFGLDALINRKYTIGIGYANNSTDIDAHNRDVEVTAHTLFAYAQYKPNKWFVNAAAQYTMADYDEDTTVMGIPVSGSYDVDSYGAQLMTGYDFATGITPSVGVRYLHMAQDDYSNELLRISGADADFATAVAGLRYAFDIKSDTSVKWSPSLYANATYDFLSDDVYSTVVLPGVANYRVRGDRLSRMGGEFGIGLNAAFSRVVVSLNYELDLHKDYTSQTGMLKLKYNF